MKRIKGIFKSNNKTSSIPQSLNRGTSMKNLLENTTPPKLIEGPLPDKDQVQDQVQEPALIPAQDKEQAVVPANKEQVVSAQEQAVVQGQDTGQEQSKKKSFFSRITSPMKGFSDGYKDLKKEYKKVKENRDANLKQKIEASKISKEEKNSLTIAKAEEKAAKKLGKLGNISKYNSKRYDIKEKKEEIIINFHEKFTRPLFFKVYPIFALILCALTLIIFFISIANILLFIGNTIYNLIILIFNDDIINYNLITYKTIFKYLKTNKTNYDNDPYFIYLEESVVYTNIFYWFIALLTLFVPFVLYIMLFLFYKFKGEHYKLIGGIKFQEIVLFIIGIVIIHLVIHTLTFNNMFGKYIFTDLKKIEAYINNVDDIVKNKLLYLHCNKDYYYELLENNDINELNKFINDEINKNDVENVKKIIGTYVLYRYFIDNIEKSDIVGRELIKNYLKDNKNGDNALTFIGLINYKKKIIKKYYTELNFIENNMATKQNDIDNIKKHLDDYINIINKNIINSPNYIDAYIKILLYMIVIFIINLIFICIISYLIIHDTTPLEQQVFPQSIVNILSIIGTTLLDYINYFKDKIMSIFRK